jgi:hypothetical protein
MNIYLLFLLNVLIIAWPLALFEILLEKDKGWGSGHSKDRWYGKIIGENNLLAKTVVKMFGIPYLFGYFLAMFGFTIPAILIAEYFLVIQNIPLLIAVFIAICFIEDFSWFVFNWYFDSLVQLLKGPNGSIWWHKKWIKISREKYLPASYVTGVILTIIFLLVAANW